jgi:hypothetical protein
MNSRITKRGERNRLAYAIGLVLIIAAGLLLRSDILPLSSFTAKYGGVALWALAAFAVFGFLFIRVSTSQLALISIAFAWSIELLQLYHAPWIDSIRATSAGHWILGSTFNAPDLVAYAIGITVGALAETLVRIRLFRK